MSPGEAIGWVIVVGFTLTFIVTLLGIVGVVEIRETYLNRLFKVLVVEVIIAGLFLFYEYVPGGPQIALEPPPSGEVYLFDSQGEPLGATLMADQDTIRDFPVIPSEVLNNVARDVEVDGVDLVIRTESTSVDLGRVRDARARLGIRLMTPEQLLGLGLHYAECRSTTENGCVGRRSAPQAVDYLVRALSAGPLVSVHELAAEQLFFLSDYVTRCSDFRLMLDAISSSRSPPKRYHELAETYLAFSRSDQVGGDSRQRQ